MLFGVIQSHRCGAVVSTALRRCQKILMRGYAMKTEEEKLEQAKKIVEKRERRSENWKKAWPKIVTVIVVLLLVFFAYRLTNLNIGVDATVDIQGDAVQINANTEAPTVAPTVAPTESTTVAPNNNGEQTEPSKTTDNPGTSSDAPKTNEEIVQKYTELLNKMKQDQPGYTKKEYQALPEEYRQFPSVVNSVLKFGEAYMTTEDSENAIVTATKGEVYTSDDGSRTMPRIQHELPICNTDKGCLITDYSCIKSASCTDNADGTRTLCFSLNDEVNPEPTPSDTCVPQSYHGAVMMPASMKDINTEVDKVVSKIPGVTINNFELTYRDGSFAVTYDPATDQVVSVVHHINVDIAANAKVFGSTIEGTARLTNDMNVYDIVY